MFKKEKKKAPTSHQEVKLSRLLQCRRSNAFLNTATNFVGGEPTLASPLEETMSFRSSAKLRPCVERIAAIHRALPDRRRRFRRPRRLQGGILVTTVLSWIWAMGCHGCIKRSPSRSSEDPGGRWSGPPTGGERAPPRRWCHRHRHGESKTKR